MDYEQKYKEALAWVESIYPELNHEHQMEAEAFFPELAESEDERIKKEIIEIVMQPTWKTEKEFHRRKELCDWIEKQGHKSTWSEEDEKMYNIVFEEYKNRQYYSHPNLKNRDICGEILGWLKSLKQRYTWKPSDEQLRELRCVISGCSFETPILLQLEEDLKKLL